MGSLTQDHIADDFDISEDMEREFSPQRKERTMAMINPSSGATKSTPMSSLYSALSQLREACSDVGTLADQLCGSALTAVGSDAGRDSSGSHFGQIEDCAHAIADLAASIDGDLKRIRGRL